MDVPKMICLVGFKPCHRLLVIVIVAFVTLHVSSFSVLPFSLAPPSALDYLKRNCYGVNFKYYAASPNLSLVSSSNAKKNKQQNKDIVTNPFFWDFHGFSCYAEITQPSNIARTNNQWRKNSNSSNKNQKPTILLIHGFGCSSVYWRETKKYLSLSGYTVHSIDLLGQGKSSKPTTADVYYSIDLWAQMIDEYSSRYISMKNNGGNSGGIVLVGNSLGSIVALSAATGDWKNSDKILNKNNNSIKSNLQRQVKQQEQPYLPSHVRGLCFYNCAVGMNSRNILKFVSQPWLKEILTTIFDVFDKLVFGNQRLLTYIVDKQITKQSLQNALLSLYVCADDPKSRVDDELINSFYEPVVKDPTESIVEVIRQIYTNNPGKLPMEYHDKYFKKNVNIENDLKKKQEVSFPSSFMGIATSPKKEKQENILPIHLIWGDRDGVTPLKGPIGKYYSDLALSTTSNINNNDDSVNSNDDVSSAGTTVDVSMQIIRAGHIPFDERPECNEGLIVWLDQVVCTPKMKKYQDETIQ